MPLIPRRTASAACTAALVATVATSLTACAGWGGGVAGGGGRTINVLMVNNPQMEDLKQLAPSFTRETGIKVRFTDLPEDDLRDKGSQEFSSQAGQYDVATLSNFEIPIYAKAGWVQDLGPYLAKDTAFDQNDILKPMREALSVNGKTYGEPFYGESSFLMYRKDVLAAKGVTMPANPTWPQVAAAAAKVDGAKPGMNGICLRGQPGWGQVMAPLTTVINTFGGSWFDQSWKATLNSPASKRGVQFYVDLVRKHGERGAAQAGYTECLNALTQGNVAMWYDSTAAAGSLEAAGSPVKGKIGYAAAPVVSTKTSGWLYTWSWAIEKASKKKADAYKFLSWASGKKYQQLVGTKLGWTRVPSGTRASLYRNPSYVAQAKAFATPTLKAISSADPYNGGRSVRPPVPGIQFVDIPEFTSLGTQVSQDISGAIAGKQSVGSALDTGQTLAADVAADYRKREGK